MRGNRFGDSVYKTFDNLQKNKENDAPVSLGKLTNEKDEFCDKINQLLDLKIWRRTTMNLVIKWTISRGA